MEILQIIGNAGNRDETSQLTFTCSKLTIKTPEQCQWCCAIFCIVNFEHISHLFLMFLLLTLNRQMLAGLFFIASRAHEKDKNIQCAMFLHVITEDALNWSCTKMGWTWGVNIRYSGTTYLPLKKLLGEF